MSIVLDRAHIFSQDKREELSARVRSSQKQHVQDKRVWIILHVCPGKKVRVRSGTMGISSWGLNTGKNLSFLTTL